MTESQSEEGRVAVVTGGSGASGGAIAARLAPEHRVVILARKGDIRVDLGDSVQVHEASRLVLDRYGRVDVLVHAAAMVAYEPFEKFDLNLWR